MNFYYCYSNALKQNNMLDLKINEIVLFQFQKSDKYRVYRLMRKFDLNISLITNKLYLVGIYIPPKKLIKSNIYLDHKLVNNVTSLIGALYKADINFFMKVYNEKVYIRNKKL